jgi:hypothetical protein
VNAIISRAQRSGIHADAIGSLWTPGFFFTTFQILIFDPIMLRFWIFFWVGIQVKNILQKKLQKALTIYF